MPYRRRATMPTLALTPNVGEGDLCKQKLKIYVHGLSHASLQVFFYVASLCPLGGDGVLNVRKRLQLGAKCRLTVFIMILRLEPRCLNAHEKKNLNTHVHQHQAI